MTWDTILYIFTLLLTFYPIRYFVNRIIIVEFRSMGFWMRSQVIIIAPMYMFLLTKIGNWVIVSHELKYRR